LEKNRPPAGSCQRSLVSKGRTVSKEKGRNGTEGKVMKASKTNTTIAMMLAVWAGALTTTVWGIQAAAESPARNMCVTYANMETYILPGRQMSTASNRILAIHLPEISFNAPYFNKRSVQYSKTHNNGIELSYQIRRLSRGSNCHNENISQHMFEYIPDAYPIQTNQWFGVSIELDNSSSISRLRSELRRLTMDKSLKTDTLRSSNWQYDSWHHNALPDIQQMQSTMSMPGSISTPVINHIKSDRRSHSGH
jgi:hypothetical protein